MTVVRRFYPDVRLKQLLAEPGGISVGEAIERANRCVESIRGDCLAAVDRKLSSIMALSHAGPGEAGEDIYRLANEIYSEAGVFGLTELSRAAHSLCQLMSSVDEGAWPKEAIAVHINAMRALRRPDVAGDDQARSAVLKGLRSVVNRMAASN